MSDLKRAHLLPLGAPKASDKTVQEPRKTVRMSVVLPEPTEDTYPEFNYKDELAAAKKRVKQKDSGNNSVPNGLSHLEELDGNDDDVRRIAKEMEEKYGTGNNGTSLNKKKRKGRKDDYADIGMGYDENDSFIDNTDGYDEIIPQNVTTLHGGFYINSGALEFKTDDEASSNITGSSSSEDDDNDEEDDDDDNDIENNEKKIIKKKRIIESSDETDRENKTESIENLNHVEKKRKLQNGNGVQQSLKKKLLSQQNKIYIKKRRLLDPQKKTVKELLREKRIDLNMSVPSDLQTSPDNNSIINNNNNNNNNNNSNNNNVEENKIINENLTSNVTNVIEAVVKASINTKSDNNDELNSNNTEIVTISSSDESSHENNDTNISDNKIDVKLPENLPIEIIDLINSIKNAVEMNTDKTNNFTSVINPIILRLERKFKCLGKPSKMKIYEYLSNCLNCKPEIYIQNAKILILKDDQLRLKTLLTRLKTEIDKVMPSLLENHEKESQRILQKKFSHDSNNTDNDDNKTLRMPKRRFQWNDMAKKLLKDILLLKKRCFLLQEKQTESVDAQMVNFLKTEIQVLWPEGWMSINSLNKIYTTYADTKRLQSNNNISISSTTTIPLTSVNTTLTITKPLSNETLKNLPQSLNNNTNLSITPINPLIKNETSYLTNDLVKKEVKIENNDLVSSNKTMLKETEIISTSPKKDIECKLKLKPACELLKPSLMKKIEAQNLLNDNVIIVDKSKSSNVKSENKYNMNKEKLNDDYCQVIDLSDKNDFNKLKIESKLKLTNTSDYTNKTKSSAGDDIQKVMEDLKVLQKMSSPKKSIDQLPTTSATNSAAAVSVIAVNKTFTHKSHNNSNQNLIQRNDFNRKNDYSSFQDEFQKQLYSAINHIASTPKTSYNSIDRFPHIANSLPTTIAADKYYQNSNNNYTQNSNGHKSTAPATQTGTFSILDDMFANLLTQYGYPKEASTSKSQQK